MVNPPFECDTCHRHSGFGKCTEHAQKNKMICNIVAQNFVITLKLKTDHMKIEVVAICLMVLLTGCVKRGLRIGDRIAWKPVYATPDAYRTISYQSPRAISRAGKFVYVNSRIFLVEQGRGIHVVSYADPMNPAKQGFIEIPGCYEASWNNGYLIANNGPDLVSMTIGAGTGVSVASRLPNVFRSIQEANSVPPDAVSGDYFECPDFSKGVLLRWEKGTVNDPECRVR
jgi:hypothetical protein